MAMAAPARDKARDRDRRPEEIAKLTAASSLAGALATAAYESTLGRSRALRERGAAQPSSSGRPVPVPGLRPGDVEAYRHPTARLAASAALSSGIVGLCFFGVREYAVSPALAFARTRAGNGDEDSNRNGNEDGNALTWTAMRTQRVPDTALAGALLGGAFNALKRGPTAIPAGALTAALACTALQFLVNEAGVQRVRFVSARRTPASTSASSSSPSSSSLPSYSSSFPSSTGSDFHPAPGHSPNSSADGHNPGEAERPPFTERVLGMLGITKVPDEEYLRRLRARRDGHLARIRELEALEQEQSETRDSNPSLGVNGGTDVDSDPGKGSSF